MYPNKQSNMIYLASTSPRRKELLKKAGINFKIIKPDYEEAHHKTISPSQAVKKHAWGKAKSCVKLIQSGIILSADTIVYLNQKIIGKPRNIKHAFNMLQNLQGKWHVVYTGFSLIKLEKGKIVKKKTLVDKTRVLLKAMTPEELRKYFLNVNPLDKAGAYAIQSKNPNIVENVKGSLNNAIGLPIEKVIKELKFFK